MARELARDPWANSITPRPALPGPVRVVRIALFVLAAFTVLILIGGLLAFDVTPELIGALLWSALPGILGFFLALRIPQGGTRRLFWLVVAVGVLSLVGALGTLGDGDPRGLTQLVVPVVLLAAVTRPAARRYLSDDEADDAYRY